MKQKSNKIRKIEWDEIFKLRLRRNASLKHEIIKLCIVLLLKEKYKKNLYWIRVYTEYPVGENKICDVYFENIKTNEIIAYEIQKDVSEQWLKETRSFYNNWEKFFFKTDWILIEEKKLPESYTEIYDKLKESYII